METLATDSVTSASTVPGLDTGALDISDVIQPAVGSYIDGRLLVLSSNEKSRAKAQCFAFLCKPEKKMIEIYYPLLSEYQVQAETVPILNEFPGV